MKKLWQNNLDWTDQSDGKAQVLQNNLPLKYDPLLYWTTQQRSSYSLTSNDNNSKLLLTSFVSHKKLLNTKLRTTLLQCETRKCRHLCTKVKIVKKKKKNYSNKVRRNLTQDSNKVFVLFHSWLLQWRLRQKNKNENVKTKLTWKLWDRHGSRSTAAVWNWTPPHFCSCSVGFF